MDTLYGFKAGQLQDYDSKGKRVPITMVKMEPSVIVGTKILEKDGYEAVRIALGTKKHPNRPLQGLLKNLPFDSAQGKQDKISPRYIRELKTQISNRKATSQNENPEKQEYKVGEKIQISDVFSAGDKVKVTGTSIGKGFAGVMKRHGFHGGPATHGQSNRARHPGSIGSTTTPGRVHKGKKMAGHMGTRQATVRNLQVFAVKGEENLLLISGLVPGYKGTLLKITKEV